MCGKSLKIWPLLLVALLFLLSAPCWPQEYDGPELPQGWYPIHEAELTELENILTQQETLLSEQEAQLRTAKQQLSEARKSLANSSVELSRLAQSLQELGDVLRRRTTALMVTAGVALLEAVLITILVIK